MVGVAGGVKDVEIGDVVASRKVYWIEPGKQTSEGSDGGSARSRTFVRPDFGPVSHRLIQTARAVVADTAWLTPARLWPKRFGVTLATPSPWRWRTLGPCEP